MDYIQWQIRQRFANYHVPLGLYFGGEVAGYGAELGTGALALSSLKGVRFIGSSRGGRIFQIMKVNQPIFRLDKAPVVLGSKVNRLHWHRGLSDKTMQLHRPYDTWLKGIKDWKY